MRRLLPIALLTLAAGCATAKAQGPLVPQPLEVPPVPPRVIVPDIEEVQPPAAESAASRPSPQRADPPPKPPDSTATEPPRTTDPPRPAETPRVRTPQTANDEQAEREVRAIMGRAQTMLQNVDYRGLSNAARQQYQTAERFIRQADNALKIRNYIFARNLADKAETLARQLGK
jgi:hypothetical protein